MLYTSYKGFVIFNTNQELDPRFRYQVSVRVKVIGTNAKLRLYAGATPEEAKSQGTVLLHNDLLIPSDTYQTLTAAFTVSTAISPLQLALYVESTENMPLIYKDIIVDDVILSKGCFPIANPVATDGSRKGSGTVTLQASGAATGHAYRWFNADGTLIAGENGATFTTPRLTSSTNYLVSIMKEGTGCESGKVTVKATIEKDKKIKPALDVEWLENDKWRVTASEEAFGPAVFGANPTYTWYRRESWDSSPEGEWGQPMQVSSNRTYTETDPADDVQLMAVVYNRESNTEYYMHNIMVAPMPVDMLYFNASKQGNTVVLQWATAMELNNAGFGVEVSTDGREFRELSFVKTLNGNCQVKQMYHFTDAESGKTGNRYYRLKQQNTDGTIQYSNMLVTYFIDPTRCLQVAPNPSAGGEVKLTLSTAEMGALQIRVLNQTGVEVYQTNQILPVGTSTQTIFLPTSLPAGIYYIHANQNGMARSCKLLKI
ncbi:Ig-like domain-containing protein [Pontibacter sp. CAU 1760]